MLAAGILQVNDGWVSAAIFESAKPIAEHCISTPILLA